LIWYAYNLVQKFFDLLAHSSTSPPLCGFLTWKTNSDYFQLLLFPLWLLDWKYFSKNTLARLFPIKEPEWEWKKVEILTICIPRQKAT
jgi:hypothetical protein